MDTEFYKIMVDLKREREISSRELAKELGLSYALIIEFYNPDKIFRLLTEKTMAKIHNKLGIDYSVMEAYNKKVLKERRG